MRDVAFAEWWAGETDLARLSSFMLGTFPSAKLVERRGEYTRWQVPTSEAPSLGQVFGNIENAKDAVGIGEYSVSQTSLEQIFNQFAAQQDEEVGAVRGMAEDASGKKGVML